MKFIPTLTFAIFLVQACYAQNNTGNPIEGAIVVDEGQQETTQFGLKINNTDSLTAGDRGPTLLEDFMLREKITHFDHERIPERVVHARGVGAHGYFESYGDWSNITAADFLKAGKKTPTFVRFSTVLGSRGSPDTVRDVRGFATRFYTDEGNFDLVGNVIAPFFIQDSIKFPDLIHAGKPEPDKEVPQAGTAHCTAYDFFAQHTESMHTVLWALSGRGLVKSFRQVEGFGVHTFRFINENKETSLVKFIWKPLQGLSNLVWDEAQKIAGKDIDYHRNDLYTAIEKGDYPEYELCVQIVAEADQDKFDFDLLDSTKIIPESLVPVTRLGKLVLNRNVDNYFAETEQVTFHLGHIVRGITFTDDPLLQGRLFSYVDTQINRMSSANYMQLPINRPHVPVHNNQRDGFMQQNVHRGKVAYYPNALQGNTPSMASTDKGYLEYPEPVQGRKQRGKSHKFSDHYSQAQLFWNSLTDPERQQLVDGARFELGKCTDPDVKEAMVERFNHVDHNLAIRVATAIGVALPQKVYPNHNQTSIGLSIENYPLVNHIRSKRVAILTGPGVDQNDLGSIQSYLNQEGAYVDLIGPKAGQQEGVFIHQTYVTAASVLYDAVYLPDGDQSMFDYLSDTVSAFPYDEPSMFVLDAYRHGKPIGASSSGKAVAFLKAAKVPAKALENDGLGVFVSGDHEAFKKGIIQQRFWARLPLDSNATPSPTKQMTSLLDSNTKAASAVVDVLHQMKNYVSSAIY